MFQTATGHAPFPFQRVFAESERLPAVVSVPTGLGKTAMAVLGWLWRRRFAPEPVRACTPRRLVYCLPMRVLVEQTRDAALRWLDRLGLLAGKVDYSDDGLVRAYDPWAGEDRSGIPVFLLLGGDVERDWDRLPDRDLILVGTQDLLLSRALIRGYACSRFRWPIQFGLLHTDTLWVLDEVQLMGSGLTTTAQLQALRRKLGARRTASVWMSATVRPDWLHTVDFDEAVDAPDPLELGPADWADPHVARRLRARKPLANAPVSDPTQERSLAKWLLEAHRPGTRTMVVVNTVDRAVALHGAVSRALGKHEPSPRIILIHSRFRPGDRQAALAALLAEPDEGGTIGVCTQVVEAGVDVSADLLVTDPAPWASLVQRFGRCNRGGEQPDARVFWLDGPPAKLAGPYRTEEVEMGITRLRSLGSAAPAELPPVDAPTEATAVLRRVDLLDLFDTSPDLSGRDVDVSPYVREGADHHVFVFWRELGEEGPTAEEPAPRREELCPVPAACVAQRIRKPGSRFWRWDIHDRAWVRVHDVVPGLTLLAPAAQGGYDPVRGWLDKPGKRPEPVPVLPAPADSTEEDAADADQPSVTGWWCRLADHTNDVVAAAEALISALSDLLTDEEREALHLAARWHDRGKAHPVFQEALVDAPPGGPWAKSAGRMKRYERPGFRHELASGLAALQAGLPDLAVWLAAAHHGRIRMAIRAWPGEPEPDDGVPRYAAGVWEGDQLPETDLGGGVVAPAVTLTLSPMELGLDPVTGPSWTERALRLRDRLGPFRLAFLEALVRVADWRGSARPSVVVEQGGAQ
ncbi:MAG: CRISPR-associated endonuclease Cas3'' [Deltaproteobacteria bacterium]|nr:MAG: CRISPR-associated endonuclease Cas3'' [Deltaproteobacteria bacterium]